MSKERKRKRVLVIYTTQLSTFVKNDIKILEKYFLVKSYLSNSVKSIFKIILEVPSSDICYIWFGTMTAAIVVFFAKLFGKKSIVIAGGLDVANEPDIGYGFMTRPLYRFFPKFAFRYADIILPFSKNAEKELLIHAKPKKHRVIYIGLETDRYMPKGPKRDIVITVGAVSMNTLQRKGIETFMQTASLIPDVPFYLVGKVDTDALSYLKCLAVPNLKIKGFMHEEELIHLFQEAKVYVQISKHEGFGCSLAEAMLCECIPVVTRSGSIPEVTGNICIYVPFGDPEATANAISDALSKERSSSARIYVLQNFPIEKREREIVQVISEIIEST